EHVWRRGDLRGGSLLRAGRRRRPLPQGGRRQPTGVRGAGHESVSTVRRGRRGHAVLPGAGGSAGGRRGAAPVGRAGSRRGRTEAGETETPAVTRRTVPAALGCRVKSGWATAVLVEGPVRSPRVVDRRAIELSDAHVPTSRQPYHAVRDARPGQAARLERYLRGVVERVSKRSLGALLKEYRRQGRR